MERIQINNQMRRYIGPGLGGSQVQELLFPWSWGVSLSTWMSSPTRKLSETLLLGLYGASWGTHDQSLIPFPAPPPLWEMWGEVENCKLLIIVWSFWWQAPIPEPTESHLIGTRDAPSALFRKLKGFRSSVPENFIYTPCLLYPSDLYASQA